MDLLSKFIDSLNDIVGKSLPLSIEEARNVIRRINDFLYTNYEGIGTTETLGQSFEYLSEFHKYWEEKHKEILDCQVDYDTCELVADALHDVYVKSKGKVFVSLYDTCGLSKENICRVRFLTANQDFRGSRNFADLAAIYKQDPYVYDEETISNDPEDFVKRILAVKLSQNDKRVTYAKTIAQFILNHHCSPFELLSKYNNNVYALRQDIISTIGSGYGNKKADMFIRDMVVLNVWPNVDGFDKIDVASDINTIKVALRTGIIKTAIPLVSSFLDIFCHQYTYIDQMNALAWRSVWKIWMEKYPTECISSPCLIDYFVYRVIGKELCKDCLYIYLCDSGEHTFKWHSGRNKTCQYCAGHGKKNIKAHVIERVMPCLDSEASIVTHNLKSLEELSTDFKLDNCPFANICNENRDLQPPKSISILGQTGWASAYAKKDNGGGGLMA